MISIENLEAMARAGIGFGATYDRPGGSGTLFISAKEVMAYMENPRTAIAAHLGVTLQEYNLWVESDGTVFCEANTKAGKRCRRMVAGTRIQYDIYDWREYFFVGGFCASHGG